MSVGKCIPDLTPETLTIDAARRALSLRLETLREALGSVLQSIDDDLEHVHQLRVACRRASAAVELFGVCIPKKARLAARQTLKTYRRAAGDARDWDVVMLALQKRLSDAEGTSGLDFLFGYCMAQRIPAQNRLEAMCPEYPFEYERWMTTVLSGLRWNNDVPARVADLGRDVLVPQFESFWERARRPGLTFHELHETRIEAKRLRYSLELLATTLPEKPLETVYRRIGEVQSILGDANDGLVGVERMEVLQRRLPQLFAVQWPRWSPLIEQLLQEYRMSMHTARDRFEVWKQKVERERLDGQIRNMFNAPTAISECVVAELAS